MSRRARTAARQPSSPEPLQIVKKGDAADHATRRSILLGHIEPGVQLLEQRIAE